MSAISAEDGFAYVSDEKVAELAQQMRIADPDKDDGAFDSVTPRDAALWLRLMDAKNFSATRPTDEDIINRLKHALWDSQRLDNYFSGKSFGPSPKLKLDALSAWPGWKASHPELKQYGLGAMRMDGFKDAARLDSYVFRHFSTSAFTQMENMNGVGLNTARDESGAWIGSKTSMQKVAMDITREGGIDTPFATLFVDDPKSSCILLLEILEVKQVKWPEPGPKLLEQMKENQEIKFGHSPKDPLVPMLQTPKMPLVVVRYSYMEGRPKEGSQFMLFLEKRLKERMPNLSPKKLRAKLQWYLQSGNEVAEPHLRMFARLLSFNSGLIDPAYVEELQSHWSGLSRDVVKETNISFFVPCLRLRWRALEEIETGIPIKILGTVCNACEKPDARMQCAACKSVFYCSADCNKGDWPSHKENCRVSKRLLSNPESFSPEKLYASIRTYVQFIPESGFAIEQEAIKYSGSCATMDCPRNEYGNERFLVLTQMPITYSHMGGRYRGQTIMFWDRRRSILARTSPGDPPMAKERGWPYQIPFHPQGYAKYVRLVRSKGVQGQQLHLWAKRVGDCLEFDLDDIPNQSSIRWT